LYCHVIGALSPWFMLAANMGVDLLLLLQLWFDGPTALLALVAIGVLCVLPCQLGMYSTFKIVFCKKNSFKTKKRMICYLSSSHPLSTPSDIKSELLTPATLHDDIFL